MPLKHVVGAIAFEKDGREYEIISLTVDHDTGRRLVPTMNSRGKAVCRCDGVESWKISIVAVIPVDDGEGVDWDNIDGAKITTFPVKKGGRRTSYLDCFSTDDSEQYEAEGEARVSVTLHATDKIKE